MLFVFSTLELNRNLWQFKTVVFLHWCLICAIPLPTFLNDLDGFLASLCHLIMQIKKTFTLSNFWWKHLRFCTIKLLPLLALATLGDMTQMEMILFVSSPKVDKASEDGIITAQNHKCFNQKTLPIKMILKAVFILAKLVS